MSTISLNSAEKRKVRINASAIASATAAFATAATVIGIAAGADIIAYLAATAGLASLYYLDRKGGVK